MMRRAIVAGLLAALACTARADWTIGVTGNRIDVEGNTIQAASDDPTLPDVPGLALWLDGADAASFTLDGAAIEAWADKSGFARHAVQHGDDATRPTLTAGRLNGRALVTFDGGDYLQSGYTPTNVAQTIIAVARCTGAGTTPRHLCGSRGTITSSDRSLFSYSDTAAGVISAGIGAQNLTVIKSAVLWTSYRIAELSFTGENVALYNGGTNIYAAAQSGAGVNAVPYLIGGLRQGTNYAATRWLGEIAELLIYSRAIASDERAEIVAYLEAKWGVE